MNIIVVKADGSYYTRPDSTLEREMKDFYLPGDCCAVEAHRCIFVKIKKAGKAVAERFAERYFDSCSRGLLFYGIMEGKDNLTPYIDYSTILKGECQEPLTEQQHSLFATALSKVTRHTSVRIGDFICIEDAESTLLERGATIDKIAVL